MWMNTPQPDKKRGSGPKDNQDHGAAAGLAAAKAAPVVAAAAVLAALWPAVIVAAAVLAAAWATGTHATRILRAAVATLPMTFGYLFVIAAKDRPWITGHLTRWEEQPVTDWTAATLGVLHGHVADALMTAPAAVPAGLAVAGAIWAWRCRQMSSGLGGKTALSVVTWDNRQWRRQARAARSANKSPGRIPLATRKAGVPIGSTIRTVNGPYRRTLVIPAPEFSRHMVIVGASGSGKTTAMIRLQAGWYAAVRRAGGKRPLLIVIDGKGGRDSRGRAAETAASLRAAGARDIRVWPDSAGLNMWALDAASLAVLLHQLIESGEGGAAYYSDISAAVIRLAVNAPGGPPRSAAEFLERLSAEWLEDAYQAASAADAEQVAAAKEQLPSIAMRYGQLMARLGRV